MSPPAISNYYDREGIADAVERGDHRDVIGGMWDEIGDLQLAFLRANGLSPASVLLDIGCGSLRLGVRAVDYLEPGHYWGTDLNASLLEAGYDREIVAAGLSDKLPRSNLVADGEFSFPGLPDHIDYCIATSVFTHLPLNHVRLCLVNLDRHVTSACTFFFTAFMPPPGGLVTQSHRHARGGKTSHPHRDPYHYTAADFEFVAAGTGWTTSVIGDWDHPRDQMMIRADKA